MQLNPVYSYSKLERGTNDQGQRRYLTPDGNKLASVTTILEATKPLEARQALAAWKRRMGAQKAQAITTEAATRGTIMHNYLEKTLLGLNPQSGTNIYHKQGWDMAQTLIENYLRPNLNEVWGLEANLYYPELYAGTTDCVGIHESCESIIDFKQTNRAKKREWIDDYFLQLCAYAEAHNEIHNTRIRKGVIMMCIKPKEDDNGMPIGPPVYQEFILEGTEFEKYRSLWWHRVEQYYKIVG
jgi:genome maintenance exonuclease 1